MSKSSSEAFPSSKEQMTASTIITEPILSELATTTQQPANLVLMPTVPASLSPVSPTGEVSLSQVSEAKSSQKQGLKSQVAPEKILEGLEEPVPKQRILQVKKSDLEGFIQMMAEFQEIIETKTY
jgi:hypothetical protein